MLFCGNFSYHSNRYRTIFFKKYEVLFLALIFSFILVLLFLNAIVVLGLIILFKEEKLKSERLKISIVIAAKNEEKIIHSLIQSLRGINFPHEDFEVILVDDNSTDETTSYIKEQVEGLNNFSIVRATNKTLPAKKGALQIGIDKAKHPYIMITDADCIIEPNWLNAFVKKFVNGFDFVFGIAPLINNGKFTGELASFENLRSTILTFSAAALNFPYSAAARNFGFKKKSFENIAGYSGTTETLSGDDDLLLREALKKKMKIGTVSDKDSFVFSKAKENFSEYIKQKSRHTETSLYYTFARQAVLALWHLVNIFSLLSLSLLFVNCIYALPFFIKIFIDEVTVISVQQKIGYKFPFHKILFYQFIYEVMLVINFCNAIFRKNEWK